MKRLTLPPADKTALGIWVSLPILGPLAALAAVFLLPLTRSKGASAQPALVGLFALCLSYGIYILGRAVFAGPLLSVVEPLEDVAPLLLITGSAAWSLRGPLQVDMARLIKALAVMLIVVLGIGLLERAMIAPWWRPRLLLGNQLNLTPLLIVPALLCTYTHLLSKGPWRLVAWAGFAAGAFMLSGVSMTRGPLLVMLVLVVLRVISMACASLPLRQRLGQATILIGLFAVTFGGALFNESALARLQLLLDVRPEPVEVVIAPAPETASSPSAQPVTETQLRLSSVSERVSLAIAGWAAFQERPLIGHGPQYRYDAVVKHLPFTPTSRYSHLHNDFVTHMVAGGVIGVMLLSSILLAPLIVALRKGPNRHLRMEIGALVSLTFLGIAGVNNVLFVWVSAFTLAISLVATMVMLEALRLQQTHTRSGP